MEFPNPERSWHAHHDLPEVDRAEITRRIGAVDASVSALSGGLANHVFLIGDTQVLRVFRRDVAALARERLIYARSWSTFRVPNVLDAGDDWLLLEFVPHSRLPNSADAGRRVGAALAEIHQQRFDQCGLFADSLAVAEPWSDFTAAIIEYLRAQGEACGKDAGPLLRECVRWAERRRDLLREHCQQSVLLHGDYKASNLHWTAEQQLLVLDWEFCYSGPAMMDLGQLARWGVPEPFRSAFVEGYARGGGRLPPGWQQIAATFDLVNLVGLWRKSEPASVRAADCVGAIRRLIDESR